jgi:hypothetical protein
MKPKLREAQADRGELPAALGLASPKSNRTNIKI